MVSLHTWEAWWQCQNRLLFKRLLDNCFSILIDQFWKEHLWFEVHRDSWWWYETLLIMLYEKAQNFIYFTKKKDFQRFFASKVDTFLRGCLALEREQLGLLLLSLMRSLSCPALMLLLMLNTLLLCMTVSIRDTML